jgi:hypothetical protein
MFLRNIWLLRTDYTSLYKVCVTLHNHLCENTSSKSSISVSFSREQYQYKSRYIIGSMIFAPNLLNVGKKM